MPQCPPGSDIWLRRYGGASQCCSSCSFRGSGSDRISRFFFFQAEDGIRDLIVTGVQTCALPICRQREIAVRIARRRRADGVEQGLRHLRRTRPGREEPDHRREILLAEQQLEALDRKSVV